MAGKRKQFEIVRLSVTLRYVEPKVARRLDVPLRVDLDLLHDYIQAAMGWQNRHLWSFETRRSGKVVHWSDGGNSYTRGDGTLLDIIRFLDGKPDLIYNYDFGDSWTHHVRIGKIQLARDDRNYPYLVSGTGRCPPEDIGGPWGYARFLRTFHDTDYSDYLPRGEGTWDAEDAGLDERRAELERLRE